MLPINQQKKDEGSNSKHTRPLYKTDGPACKESGQ